MRVVALVVLLACSKSEKKPEPAPAAPPAADASAGSSVPSEPAAVKGPTRSAKGALDVSGTMAGTFEWKKKDQHEPISCAWNAEKKIGGLHIDLSDGNGHVLTLAIDAPPKELGKPRLDAISADLPSPLKTSSGFEMSGDDAGHIKVVFDTTLSTVVVDPDAPKKKKAEKPTGPTLTIKGTLEVDCPPKK